MHDPFDNPEIAAASRKCGWGGWVVNARPVPAAPVIPQRPVPAGRGVSVCGPAIRTGQQVFHVKFGEGRVLAVEGSGDDARAQVNFPRHGVKWLALAIAKLTVVD